VSERLGRAAEYAADVHAKDVRKGTTIPYISHLLAVSAIVFEDGGDEDEAVAGLLHDAAEDHGGAERLEDIEGRFGSRVREVVAACSDTLPAEGEEKGPWRERKERYLAHLERTDDLGALRVSAADKLHNARAILGDYAREGEGLWKRFATNSAEDQLWYYGRLVEIHRAKRPESRVVEELAEVVAALERAVRGVAGVEAGGPLA
jgi:(p)ppGpp synthase/HD superfamily hydrolase